MEKKVLIHSRVKNIITHISTGLKERDEVLSLALLCTIASQNMLLYGSQGTGKSLIKQHLNYAFKNPQKIAQKKLIFISTKDDGDEVKLPSDLLVKFEATPIQDDNSFLKLIDNKNANMGISKAEGAFEDKEFAQFNEQIKNTKLSPEAQLVILTLRRKFSSNEDENFYISDDRWVRIAWLLKAAAFLNGHKTVDLVDCLLITHCIWQIGDERFNLVRDTLIQISQNNNLTKFDESIPEIGNLVQDYINFIEENFFVISPVTGEKIKSPELFGYVRPAKPFPTEMNDGTPAYRILKPEEIRSYDYITPYYISESFKDYPEGNGAYFDDFRERVEKTDHYRDKYFTKNLRIEYNDGVGIASWTDGSSNCDYSAEIKMIPEEFVAGDDDKLERLRALADERARILIERIQDEESKIQKYIKRKERQYKTNLFADASQICDELLQKANETKNRLAEYLEILSTEMSKMQEGIK